ncbi:MAG: hypothetical protein ACI82A_002497 [Candidatus Azotimanducaceae bacterium]|jgi:hypothetical protein
MVEDLPTGYYLDNFRYLLTFVQGHYADVLSDAELNFCTDFECLTRDAQRLYVRLMGRKGPHFRHDKLSYDEISDLSHVLDQLVKSGFVARNHIDDADSWLRLATRPELLSHFDVSNRAERKDALCTAVIAAYSVTEIQTGLPFDLLEPQHVEALDVFRLLFFGNLYQDLTEFVLRDLGINPYEKYALDGRNFSQRQLVDDSLLAYQLQAMAYVVMASPELCLAEFAETFLLNLEISNDPQLSRRHCKILNRVARQLERESVRGLAMALYEKSELTPARERRTRLLVEEGQPALAIELCERICKEPLSEEEFEFALSFAPRIAKKHGLPPALVPPKQKDVYPVESICIPYIEGQRVEQTSADWIANGREDGGDGGVVRYVENGLLPGLFGLYFWDIIFTPLSGVFFNPFQRGPADLFTEQFLGARETMIEQRLLSLDDGAATEQKIQQTFIDKFGIANYFVMWRTLDQSLISLALERIPVDQLRAVFRRMLRDLKSNRSGFPDLVVFPVGAGYELVEIKGPGDSLQKNQKRWLRFFEQQGMSVRVINVTWQA